MLQQHCVTAETLNLLNELMNNPALKHFALAGGTALALKVGHRISVDLDFFTTQEFDPEDIISALKKYNLHITEKHKNSINLFINDVKVDFIRHNYEQLKQLSIVDNVRLFSMEDICAMKLNAVSNRGSKKDFVDIYFLLKQFSLNQMMELFERKYPSLERFFVLKSMIYFDDADLEPDPVLFEKIEWNQIKKAIIKEVNSFK